MHQKVFCRQIENFQVQVIAGSHAWISDEPVEVGGDGTGPNPFDLLLGSLGSCMTITVCHFAARGGIPVTHVSCVLEGNWEGSGQENRYAIRVRVRVRGDLDDGDLDQLREFSGRCPIHVLLSQAADVETVVERAP